MFQDSGFRVGIHISILLAKVVVVFPQSSPDTRCLHLFASGKNSFRGRKVSLVAEQFCRAQPKICHFRLLFQEIINSSEG